MREIAPPSLCVSVCAGQNILATRRSTRAIMERLELYGEFRLGVEHPSYRQKETRLGRGWIPMEVLCGSCQESALASASPNVGKKPKVPLARARHTFSTFSSLDSPTCPLRTLQEGVHSPYRGAFDGCVVWG